MHVLLSYLQATLAHRKSMYETVPVLQLGLSDIFIEHGDSARLLSIQGLDATGIQASIAQRFGGLLKRMARAA